MGDHVIGFLNGTRAIFDARDIQSYAVRRVRLNPVGRVGFGRVAGQAPSSAISTGCSHGNEITGVGTPKFEDVCTRQRWRVHTHHVGQDSNSIRMRSSIRAGVVGAVVVALLNGIMFGIGGSMLTDEAFVSARGRRD